MKEQTAETPEKEVGKNSEMTEEHTEMPAEDSVPVEETDTLAAENEQLKAQVEQLKKDYLLARADLENFRKRRRVLPQRYSPCHRRFRTGVAGCRRKCRRRGCKTRNRTYL